MSENSDNLNMYSKKKLHPKMGKIILMGI